jgi:hypothetical protein
MPDYAPNVTARYKVKYQAVGRTHTVQCRLQRGSIAGDIISNGAAFIQSVFSASTGLLTDDFGFISAEYALEDSDLFFPAAVPGVVVGLIDVALFSKQDSITHYTFSGRGSGGSKVNMKLYGLASSPDDLPDNLWSDFVVNASESPTVEGMITALNSAPAGIVAIDNTRPTWHARATVKVNDDWLRKVRQGL